MTHSAEAAGMADLVYAATMIAAGAPEKPGANVSKAQIPWSRITELRNALDLIGADWRKIQRAMKESR